MGLKRYSHIFKVNIIGANTLIWGIQVTPFYSNSPSDQIKYSHMWTGVKIGVISDSKFEFLIKN